MLLFRLIMLNKRIYPVSLTVLFLRCLIRLQQQWLQRTFHRTLNCGYGKNAFFAPFFSSFFSSTGALAVVALNLLLLPGKGHQRSLRFFCATWQVRVPVWSSPCSRHTCLQSTLRRYIFLFLRGS